MQRSDGRQPDEIRAVKIVPHYQAHPTGSCLIEVGGTRVICSVFLEETVPPFLKGSGKGWLTAEYGMLPGSTHQRVQRERMKIGGRTHEIQRLIGRSLRNCIDLASLGERSLLIDCDVLDADGGTRTAAITGSYVALVLALRRLRAGKPDLAIREKQAVAAISVGIVRGIPCVDLHYDDDKDADVDMNVVKTSDGKYVEVQGTAEAAPFDRALLDRLLAMADRGIEALLAAQKKALDL
jgi:ribonuclease PH